MPRFKREALCQKGTTNAEGEVSDVFRCFAYMTLQQSHIRGGLGMTPNAGSAISNLYAASASLVQWLGYCSPPEVFWTSPAHGPRAKIWPILIYCPYFACSQASSSIEFSSQNLAVMNDLSMGLPLPLHFRKLRVRALILCITLHHLHLATSTHL